MGLSNKLSCEVWSFSQNLNPHRCFQLKALRLYFPVLEAWVGRTLVCLAPRLFLPVYLRANVGPPTPPAAASLGPPATTLPALVLLLPPCHEYSPPGCPSPPLLLVWVNLSSLTPWLSGFHTVRFSVSSSCFLFLNLLLSLFWLCEEAQCIHLCLHHFREGKGGRLRGRETPIGFLPPTPNRGPGPQPRHVP